MKKLLFIASTFITLSANAQSEKFIKAMEPKVVAIDTTRSVEGLKDLANAFERIADAEKTQWLPYYYAALAHVNSGYASMGLQKMISGEQEDVIDPIADKAEVMLNKAEALAGENSEILCVKSMIATLKIIVNPSIRGMQYGPKAEEYIVQAKKRLKQSSNIFLEGQSAMFKPVEWGGGKDVAKALLDVALIKYEIFKPISNIHPNWGKSRAKLLVSKTSN